MKLLIVHGSTINMQNCMGQYLQRATLQGVMLTNSSNIRKGLEKWELLSQNKLCKAHYFIGQRRLEFSIHITQLQAGTGSKLHLLSAMLKIHHGTSSSFHITRSVLDVRTKTFNLSFKYTYWSMTDVLKISRRGMKSLRNFKDIISGYRFYKKAGILISNVTTTIHMVILVPLAQNDLNLLWKLLRSLNSIPMALINFSFNYENNWIKIKEVAIKIEKSLKL